MSKDSMQDDAKILYCHCAYARVILDGTKDAVLRGLVESGREFRSVADLCELSARNASELKELADETRAADGELRIAACYPRVVKWLFHQGGAPLPEGKWRVGNMRTEDPKTIVEELLHGKRDEAERELE